MFGSSYNPEEFYSSPLWTQEYHHVYPFVRSINAPNNGQYSHGHIFSSDTLLVQSHQQSLSRAANQQIKKKRTSRPKVRTGCKTCKIRRIKCGEEKPACLRCTSTGRKCDGYDFPSKTNNKVVTDSPLDPPHPLPPVCTDQQIVRQIQQTPEVFISTPGIHSLQSTFEGTVQDKRAFHRFRYRTVPVFAGGSETEFWTDLVLRAATTEHVIRYAVIALGTLHEDYESREGSWDQSLLVSAAYKDSALLYGRAIRHLYQRIDSITGETASLAVIASIIFACFEVLRRNNMAAVMHYQNGMKQLLRSMGERDRVDPAIATKHNNIALIKATPQDDQDRMLRVLARYDVQACTFSKTQVEPLRVDLSVDPPTGIGLSEVRMYLDNLLIAVYQLVKSDLSMFRYWTTSDVPAVWLEKRDQALGTFEQWLNVLEQSIPSDVVTLRNHGVTASKSILGLILQIKIAMIMLRMCVDQGPETSYDKFQEEFEEMVCRVENMTKALGLRETVSVGGGGLPFTMELGVIHPLFFIACKCRSWNVRRRAIAELRKCGKEGVWEGPIMAIVADRIVEIEEQGLKFGALVTEAARVHDIRKSVDYENGVVRAELKLAQDSSWKSWTILREALPFL